MVMWQQPRFIINSHITRDDFRSMKMDGLVRTNCLDEVSQISRAPVCPVSTTEQEAEVRIVHTVDEEDQHT